jgi:hypothetical protein
MGWHGIAYPLARSTGGRLVTAEKPKIIAAGIAN